MTTTSSALSAPPSFRRATTRTRLILVGDSTVCERDLDSNYRGWGQYLFASSPRHEVINLARSGASTKTFTSEGLWEKALELRPDWILMQFGHNDSHAQDQPESTRAQGDYADNLRRFVADARALGSAPILVTPVRRFHFGADNCLIERESALRPYAAAMRAVAAEMNVPIVDLFEASTRFFESIGPCGANQLSPEPGVDFSHFNERGARAIAELVEAELRAIAPALAGNLSGFRSLQHR